MLIRNHQIQEDAYGILDSKKGLMAVLASEQGKYRKEKSAGKRAVEIFEYLFRKNSSFYAPRCFLNQAQRLTYKNSSKELHVKTENLSVAAVLIRNQKLYYTAAGSVITAVYRDKGLFFLSGGYGAFPLSVVLKSGDYVMLLSRGLSKSVTEKELLECLEEPGTCEEKAVKLAGMASLKDKNEKNNPAVVMMRMR